MDLLKNLTEVRRVAETLAITNAIGAQIFVSSEFLRLYLAGTLPMHDAGDAPHYVFDTSALVPPPNVSWRISDWTSRWDKVAEIIRTITRGVLFITRTSMVIRLDLAATPSLIACAQCDVPCAPTTCACHAPAAAAIPAPAIPAAAIPAPAMSAPVLLAVLRAGNAGRAAAAAAQCCSPEGHCAPPM